MTYQNTKRVIERLGVTADEVAEIIEAIQDDLEIHEPQARGDIEACRNLYDLLLNEI